MTSPRLRRLQADYRSLTAAFSGHPRIRVEPVGPVPPERYRILYAVPSLAMGTDQFLHPVESHLVEVFLPSEYPRDKPYCTLLSTPVFHPNFGPYICIADFWSPGQTLVDVVVQIGDMLQYKLFNVRSPLNAVAARWATENTAILPIGRFQMQPLEPEISVGATRTLGEPDA